jgi:hypothetical protein
MRRVLILFLLSLSVNALAAADTGQNPFEPTKAPITKGKPGIPSLNNNPMPPQIPDFNGGATGASGKGISATVRHKVGRIGNLTVYKTGDDYESEVKK